MPYKDRSMKSQRQKERRKGEAPAILKSQSEAPIDQYHPVMKWLIPGERRDKLEKIVQSLKRHNVLRNTYLGCGVHSLPLDVVAEMLEVTQYKNDSGTRQIQMGSIIVKPKLGRVKPKVGDKACH